MKRSKKTFEQSHELVGIGIVERLWSEGWTYIKTVVDIVQEPILILDEELRVVAANGPFYKTFKVDLKDTENKVVYELGNGQWNIPALRKLLEDILPKHTFFKGFEVTHEFPSIGRKIMMLNARQIRFKEDIASKQFPPIILLAIEDVTEIIAVAKKLSGHVNEFETKHFEEKNKLMMNIIGLKKEITMLKASDKFC